MGGFDIAKIKNLLNEKYKIAIETGTYIGNGTNTLSKYFEKIYTIEIDKTLFDNAKEKFKDNENIICLNGDSKEVILELSNNINNTSYNILFWLDAHWSGDNTVNWEKSKWKGMRLDNKIVNTGYIGKNENNQIPYGQQQVPLEDEILNIYEHINNECILYIDDFDKICPVTLKGLKNKCFEGEDWSHLDFNKLFKIIDDRVIFKRIIGNQCILKFKEKN